MHLALGVLTPNNHISRLSCDQLSPAFHRLSILPSILLSSCPLTCLYLHSLHLRTMSSCCLSFTIRAALLLMILPACFDVVRLGHVLSALSSC